MRKQRAVAVLLSSLVVLAGLWVLLVAEDTQATGPEVSVPTTARSPGKVSGTAVDPSGKDVTVTASIDGEELDGSPDEEMEGGMNEFSFNIPPGKKGKILEITATSSDGSSTTVYVTIV